jgi:hypothetical protein
LKSWEVERWEVGKLKDGKLKVGKLIVIVQIFYFSGKSLANISLTGKIQTQITHFLLINERSAY